MIKIYITLLLGLLLVSCNGQKRQKDVSVVATTAWTAAIAEAAGADDVVVLAPMEMEHPSEYELKPGDIKMLLNAKLIVYAGYEVMTERLKTGLDIPSEKLLLVETDYSYEAIEKSVMAIANRLGTTTVAEENLLEISQAFEEGRKAVAEKGLSKESILVHLFQVSLVKELGMQPTTVFGPAAPEASEIAGVAKMNYALILDNIHNPVGQPFHEVLPAARYVQLLNFPGMNGTKNLSDVIRYNVTQISGQ